MIDWNKVNQKMPEVGETVIAFAEDYSQEPFLGKWMGEHWVDLEFKGDEVLERVGFKVTKWTTISSYESSPESPW